MNKAKLPTVRFCKSVIRFLDTIGYDDNNLTREQRISGLREVHAKTSEYFAQPLSRKTLKDVHPARIPIVCCTISCLVASPWPYVPHDAQVEITIWQSIINVLDDGIGCDPITNTSNLLTNMLAGRPTSHPFWKLMQAHLLMLLAYLNHFCGVKIIQSIVDFFEGCGQHSFECWHGADCYPLFVRRLTTLGGALAGTLLPTLGGFENKALLKKPSSCRKSTGLWPAPLNNLFSFYMEFDREEPDLVSNLATVEGITMEQALVHSCIFIHGYATKHFGELRYRMKEAYDAAAAPELRLAGKRFRVYQDSAFSVGWVPLEEWSLLEGQWASEIKTQRQWSAGVHDLSRRLHSSIQLWGKGCNFGTTP